MNRFARTVSLLALPLAIAGCSAAEAPRANRTLRRVPLTSSADLEAYDIADAAGDQLRTWCSAALKVREEGESLAADDPIVDGRAAVEVERLHAASQAAEGGELAASLTALALAHEERLAVLAAGRKFAAKRYLRADRKVTELAFGLRRWRLQR